MAWRIDAAVVRGTIDNTEAGLTVGKIWLTGRENPLELHLQGDCWRDLAGTRLEFTNPNPVADEDAASMEPSQTGVVGDMSASRKVRVQTSLASSEWRNMLYLEWFSEINGRVVIETTDFDLKISDHTWSMDADSEEAQQLANLNSMRGFMDHVLHGEETEVAKAPAGELDEFQWERRLRNSDRLTDAYQEVLEKYMEDPASEQKEAFVMGWDSLLEALAELDEEEMNEEFSEDEFHDSYELAEDEDENDARSRDLFPATSFDEDYQHPLQVAVQQLALKAIDLFAGEETADGPAARLISHLLQINGKLAGALNDRSSGYETEHGYILAVLKRCLFWLNETLGACQELLVQNQQASCQVPLAAIQASIFEVRAAIVELRRVLKQK